jgi:hypothetical protein
MRILALRKHFHHSYNLYFLFKHAQVGNTTIKQDSKFEQLLNERKINVSNAVNDYYKFKYSVVIAKSKNTLAEFRQAFSGMDGTIIFNTPNYKVWVGNYKSRIEGNVTLSILKKISNVHLIRPTR